MGLRRDLSYFDLMNIVIGAIVGSDIYIVPGITAGLIGPFAIVIWVIGGVGAMVLAMVFGYCAYYVPNVGGSYAYVSTAFNKFYGFVAGWSMCIAEIVALPVFAIVFVSYLQYFVPLDAGEQLVVKTLFVLAFVAINIRGVKAAGRLNDVLTLAKLTPLLLIILLGLGSLVLHPKLAGNFAPFAPFGLNNFGTVMVLVFWAYAGFELGSLPSSEVVDPKRNVPRALIAGMAIVVFFYVLTNIAVFGLVSSADLAKSAIPLVLVSTVLLGTAGAVITGVGALASVSGTDETEVMGTARLIYAMSADGLLPKALARVHPRFKTPHVAILLEGAIALALSLFTGITQLISFAVFNLGVCYLLVCLSLAVLNRKNEKGLPGQGVIPWLGAAISLYLLYSTSLLDKVLGSAFVLLGIPVYVFFAKTTAREVEAELEKQYGFLANLVRLIRAAYRRLAHRPKK